MKKNLGRHLKHREPWQTPITFADFKEERINLSDTVIRSHLQIGDLMMFHHCTSTRSSELSTL